MHLPREDACCPACPNPETAFRIEDVGMTIVHEDYSENNTMRIMVSRPAWEPIMLEHLRSRLDDDGHRRLYDLCVTELIAAGMSAEESARNQVQAVADSVRRSMNDALRGPQ